MVKWCTSGEGTIKDMGPEVECGRPWTTVDDRGRPLDDLGRPWTERTTWTTSDDPGRPRTTPDDLGRPLADLNGFMSLFIGNG